MPPKPLLRCLLALSCLAACSSNDPAVTTDSGVLPDAAPADAAPQPDAQAPDAAVEPAHRAIIFVWDGLRPDQINATDTPTLAAMRTGGVDFTDNHSTYPTFTMMNAASLATGGFPAQTGFYGNTLWQPGPVGADSGGNAVNFRQPVFTEDWAILADLDAYYGYRLLLVGTLFQAAQRQGLVTAAVGKSGPAFLQDFRKGGYILDEKLVYPISLAQELQAAGVALPKATVKAYPDGYVNLTASNGDPTAAGARVNLTDGTTSDGSNAAGSPNDAQNLYLMTTYLDHILAPHRPDLSLIWLRSPDSTEHTYGVGSPNYKDAMRQQDMLLGMLQSRLRGLGLEATTDVIVVSDHGHSNVSGPHATFPLRALTAGAVGAPDVTGFSVSGDVRIADLLTRAGFAAFDGAGCTNDPVMSGIKADGTPVYPVQTDTTGTVCGTAGAKYVTPPYRVPATLPAHGVVIAANGGSDYLYVPDHDAATVASLVRFLQGREEVGAIFVASSYGALPGTLALDRIQLEDASGHHPDIVFSYDWNADALVQGVPGIEYESAQNNRGMHGSFSPRDVHNTLLAQGPDFRAGFSDPLPSGNVDVAPTVARILGLPLPQAAGRPLLEALAGGPAVSTFTATPSTVNATAAATGLVMQLPTDPAGAAIDTGKSQYTVQLKIKTVASGGKTWTYFDSAAAVRQ